MVDLRIGPIFDPPLSQNPLRTQHPVATIDDGEGMLRMPDRGRLLACHL